jgi:hypothetical protein
MVCLFVASAELALGQSLPMADPVHAGDALAEAERLDRLGDATAVDFYFEAAAQTAHLMRRYPATITGASDIEEIYAQALAGLIDSSQRYARLDPPRRGILLNGGSRVLPIRYFGFAWQPTDFTLLMPAHYEQNKEIANHYISAGIGLPLIAERVTPQPLVFARERQPFAATAVLKPPQSGYQQAGRGSNGFVLELYNPLAYDKVRWGGYVLPLARDLTAPLAREINENPRQYLRGFTSPNDTSVQPQLYMLEPYQRGKIPVVLIHGLYSDPTTWADMLNELRVQDDIYTRYQFWVFRYPTGGSLLNSMTALRQQLLLARMAYDPFGNDYAMDNMVLIGHSLGGLVAKSQVTSSNDQFWGRIAQQPFAALRAPPLVKQRFAENLFFEPVPYVKQVIFIGTPHRGSQLTLRVAGRIGNALVSFNSTEAAEFQQVIEINQDVFRPDFSREPPTSIALLEPDSPFLAGLANMPINPATHIHSIIGTGGGYFAPEPGDGVVAVSSARHCGESELFVPTVHEELHRDPESINEVARILRQHAAMMR